MNLRWVFLHSTRRDEWGGIENWILSVARGLQRIGDVCCVIAPPDSRWRSVCTREGFEFDSYTFGWEGSPRSMGRLAGLLKWHKTDVVLCTTFREARRVRYVTRVPAVGVKLPLLRDLTDGWLDRMSFRYAADRLFADHRRARQLLLRHPWVQSGKILLVPNGVETAGGDPDPVRRAAARALLTDNPTAVLIGVASRFNAEKRVMDAIRIFRRVMSAHPSSILVLIGNGPQRGELERAARDCGDRVRFLGWRDDAAELLCGCDVVLHTGASEAMPNSVLEGMAAGAVVISTDVGGTREIITSGRDGFLFRCGNVSAMADCLNELLADPVRRRRIGEAAAHRAAESFSMEKVVRRIRDGMAAVVEARRQLWPENRRAPDGARWVARSDYDGPWDHRILLPPSSGSFTGRPVAAASSGSAAEFEGGALVRVYISEGFWDRLLSMIREPRARSMFRAAHRLELMGIPVAPHRAVTWMRFRNFGVRSALVLGEVRGAVPAPEWAKRHADLPEALRMFAASAGIWLAGLHTLHVYPSRLDPEKIFVRLGAEIRPEFILGDLDECRFPILLPPHAPMKNLTQLYGVFSSTLPYRHLLRFAAAYRRARGLSRQAVRRLIRLMPV